MGVTKDGNVCLQNVCTCYIMQTFCLGGLCQSHVPKKNFREYFPCPMPPCMGCRGRLCQKEIERIARGIYRKPDAPHIPYPEIEILLKRKTRFVVALQSALRLHNFTTAMPSSLWIALSRGGRVPSVDFPLDHVFLSGASWTYGIQTIDSHGLSIPVFSPAKTVADIFKFRNKIGLDAAIESLREGLRKNLFDVSELLGAAKVNRVENIITPYVEALI